VGQSREMLGEEFEKMTSQRASVEEKLNHVI
jgi:hypothetical protein